MIITPLFPYVLEIHLFSFEKKNDLFFTSIISTYRDEEEVDCDMNLLLGVYSGTKAGGHPRQELNIHLRPKVGVNLYGSADKN